jgi:Icc-related predicted phosphoesterase
MKDRSLPGYGEHFGSTVVWDMITRHQPVVSIGGHMHENPGMCKLGKTIAINAGMGADANIFIELSGNQATKIEFYK